MTRKKLENAADLADFYNETADVSEFEDDSQAVGVRRNVTISVRFSEDEIAELRRRADESGMKVTALIRAAALDVGRPPLNREAVIEAAAALRDQIAVLTDFVWASDPDDSAARFEVFEDASGKFRFRLKGSDGHVIASGDAYETRAAAVRGIEAMQRTANLAKVAG